VTTFGRGVMGILLFPVTPVTLVSDWPDIGGGVWKVTDTFPPDVTSLVAVVSHDGGGGPCVVVDNLVEDSEKKPFVLKLNINLILKN